MMADAIDDAFWLAAPDLSRFDYVSPAFATLWGVANAELLQAPEVFMQTIHPDDRYRVEAEFSLHGDQTHEVEYRLLRADGEEIWIHDRRFPIRDGGGSAGLVAGLAVIRFVKAPWLDPVLSIAVACYILFEALRLVRRGLHDVLDAELPAPLLAEIVALIEAHKDDHIDYHHLRTRRAGSQKIIDFHLTICKDLSVEQAHEIADHIEKRIEEEIRGADVTIHSEPCREPNCPGRSRCPVAEHRTGKNGR